MIKFPDISETQTTEEKLKILMEYLWQFHAEIEHILGNLSTDNFNDKTLKELARVIKEENDETTEA